MKNKYVFVTVMSVVLLVICMGIASLGERANQNDHLCECKVVTSFYPMYIAAMNVTEDVPGVELYSLSEPQTGCLHDFVLTPEDMQLLSTADVFIINGGGIESFMEEVASAYPDLVIIDTTKDLTLLADDEEVNAHAWMNVSIYRGQVEAIAQGLSACYAQGKQQFMTNAAAYDEKLRELQVRQDLLREHYQGQKVVLFHEADAYVADALGMQVTMVLDLDEERQVSAGEIADVVDAIEDGADLILAEELYGAKTASTVQAECEVRVLFLDPLNRGDYEKDSYLAGMSRNLELLEN